jgi:UDPglucose 6-dehydrogenase
MTGADAAIVVTEWPELKDVVWAEVHDVMHRAVTFDGRNLLDPST